MFGIISMWSFPPLDRGPLTQSFELSHVERNNNEDVCAVVCLGPGTNREILSPRPPKTQSNIFKMAAMSATGRLR